MQVGIELLQLLGVFNEFLLDGDALRGHEGVALQLFDVGRAVETDVEGVAHQVVEFVRAEVSVADPGGQGVVAGEHRGQAPEVDTNAVQLPAQGFEQADAIGVVVAVQDRLDLVRKRAMAEVVQKRKGLQVPGVVVIQPVDANQALRQRQGADRVLKARMHGAGKDEVVDPELAPFPQGLKGRGVNQRRQVGNVNRGSAGNADRFLHGGTALR